MIFKRLTVALAALLVLTGSCFASGTIPFSLSQQLDQYGKPLAGCLFYTIKAGTTSTPQNAFQDSALTIPLPNPQTCDAGGRLPQMFLADGTIKVRLTDKYGTVIVSADNIQVIGASSGGGGGGSVDPTTIASTGQFKQVYGTSILSGWVRANGRTIGSATSGATERANADCQALFEFLWNADSSLSVSGGRGSSANADWVANKTLTLPDSRGRALASLSDMGNTDVGLYSGVTFASGSATTLGTLVGAARTILGQDNLPAVSLPLTGTAGTVTVATTATDVIEGHIANETTAGGGTAFDKIVSTTGFASSKVSTGTFTPQGTVGPLGSGSAFDSVSPFLLVTTYIKL
jgi:hypothetical protein